MKRLLIILLLALPLAMRAQDTLDVPRISTERFEEVGTGEWSLPEPPDTVYVLRTDTVTLLRVDTVTQVRVDSVYILRTDTIVRREADTAALKALQEKEVFYREILTASGVDKEKLEAERNYYIHMVDSLRTLVRIAELENVRKEEANKYLEERVRIAEERSAQVTNRKKKVRPIQGVAMRFYRTPEWEFILRSGEQQGTYEKLLSNRNAGSIEFDYVTGASVMLWDLTKYFNKDLTIGNDSTGRTIRRFDQDFAYDLGLYVGFGGSNLFKNFYVGASFRFVDFFYITGGVNIAEYTVLKEGYEDNHQVGDNLSLKDVTASAWLVKPFISLSIDLDFLSYIKK